MTQKCQFYLSNGLAPSTRRVYSSAQKQFLDFCIQDGSVNQDGFILPASEQTLMRFCSHLADRRHHTSIKVHLSGVHSLHIDMGFGDPLANCLQLQRVLRGIKRHQGSRTNSRKPVTGDLMKVIHGILTLSDYTQSMMWAACCVGFFGFLRAGEFTVNSPFDTNIHLTLQDLQLDSTSDPSCCGFISSVQKWTLFVRAVLSTWGVVAHPFALFLQLWLTFTSGARHLVLSSFTKMVAL